ncbi:MAG: type II toxin-antitoxin system death-on-curing family toxin [bacterium]
MNEIEIFYPDKDLIKYWIELLRSKNYTLKTRLPITDEEWFSIVEETIERIKIQYIEGVHSKASHLFFYLNKNHNFIDGNKRTTIVVIYLFYLVNNYTIISSGRLEELAKKLAKSHGSRNKDDWMKKIEKELSYIAKPINKIVYN